MEKCVAAVAAPAVVAFFLSPISRCGLFACDWRWARFSCWLATAVICEGRDSRGLWD
jgi:hypothetical protein